MEKRVIVTALEDRPTLALKKGDKLKLNVNSHELVNLYSEAAKGLITVSEEPELDDDSHAEIDVDLIAELESISSTLLLLANAYEGDSIEISAEDQAKTLYGLHRHMERIIEGLS